VGTLQTTSNTLGSAPAGPAAPPTGTTVMAVPTRTFMIMAALQNRRYLVLGFVLLARGLSRRDRMICSRARTLIAATSHRMRLMWKLALYGMIQAGTTPGRGRNENGQDLEQGLCLSPRHEFTLTSSWTGHAVMPPIAHLGVRARQDYRARHPSRQSFGTTRRIRPDRGPEATWAQPLIREELS